jgi:hypothetical protein
MIKIGPVNDMYIFRRLRKSFPPQSVAFTQFEQLKSQSASQPASQTASQPANQPASHPVDRPAD